MTGQGVQFDVSSLRMPIAACAFVVVFACLWWTSQWNGDTLTNGQYVFRLLVAAGIFVSATAIAAIIDYREKNRSDDPHGFDVLPKEDSDE